MQVYDALQESRRRGEQVLREQEAAVQVRARMHHSACTHACTNAVRFRRDRACLQLCTW